MGTQEAAAAEAARVAVGVEAGRVAVTLEGVLEVEMQVTVVAIAVAAAMVEEAAVADLSAPPAPGVRDGVPSEPTPLGSAEGC